MRFHKYVMTSAVNIMSLGVFFFSIPFRHKKRRPITKMKESRQKDNRKRWGEKGFAW